MQNVSVFLPESNRKRIAIDIKNVFPDATVSFTPSADDWQQATLSRKAGWFSTDKLTINMRSVEQPDQFTPMMQGMAAFVDRLPVKNEAARTHLTTQIQGVRVALGIVGSKLEPFEAGLLSLAARLNGFLFVDGTSFINSNGQLLLDVNGDSELPIVKIDEPYGLPVSGVSPLQQARKERSVVILKERDIPYIDHLPVVDDEITAHIRSREAIVQRALAVAVCAVKAEGLEAEILQSVIDQFGVEAYFTSQEQAFIRTDQPTEADRAKFGWRYECLTVLLWALGYIEELPFPSEICDVGQAVSVIYEAETYERLLNNATVRSTPEILDQLDLTYRLDWACVNARVQGKPAPDGVDSGVVYERHYAFNWLTHYFDQEWDDVSTDT